MSWALIWLLAAIALCALELLTTDFTLLMIGLAALLASGGALIWPSSLLAQAIVFVVCATVFLLGMRPVLRRRFTAKNHATNVEALVGRPAVVVETVDSSGGRVKIGGEEWSALPSGEHTWPVGQTLQVVRIHGATAIVSPATQA